MNSCRHDELGLSSIWVLSDVYTAWPRSQCDNGNSSFTVRPVRRVTAGIFNCGSLATGRRWLQANNKQSRLLAAPVRHPCRPVSASCYHAFCTRQRQTERERERRSFNLLRCSTQSSSSGDHFIPHPGPPRSRWNRAANFITFLATYLNMRLRHHFPREKLIANRGVATGGIGIHTPKSVYLTNFYVVTGCFFFSLTQDKLLLILKLEWLVKIYTPPQMKSLATPLIATERSSVCFLPSHRRPTVQTDEKYQWNLSWWPAN